MISKKQKTAVTLLLVADGILHLFVPEISKFAYIIMWVIALILWWGICRIDKQREAIETLERMNSEIIEEQFKALRMLHKRLWHLKERYGINEHIGKIYTMPKITSATGQIYVNFDEVMRILEGGDIVER